MAFLLVTVFLIMAGSAVAAPSADLLAPGGWNLITAKPGEASLETVNAASEGHEVLRLVINTPTDPVWNSQVIRAVPADVPSGHLLWLHFRARSATRNSLRVALAQNGPPYEGVGVRVFALTPEWQDYTVGGPSPGLGANSLGAHFQVGKQKGIIEISDVTVTDAGMDPSLAVALTAIQPEKTEARIEKIRKGTLKIKAVDAAGQPIQGAAIKVTQTRHAFLFGSNLFPL
ncbi:MAG: hypothetical protein ABIP97_13000, partial [Chthoniobacterales bacterium]